MKIIDFAHFIKAFSDKIVAGYDRIWGGGSKIKRNFSMIFQTKEGVGCAGHSNKKF